MVKSKQSNFIISNQKIHEFICIQISLNFSMNLIIVQKIKIFLQIKLQFINMIILRKVKKCCSTKQASQFIHKFFIALDSSISLLSLLVLLINGNGQTCLASFYLYWSLFYLGQAISHYLLVKLPKIDVCRFDKSIKKLIGIIGFIQIAYLLLVIMFWAKSDLHPIYCAVCGYFHWPFVIGIVFIIHFIITAGIAITLIHLYVTRKYYLIALGGFQVQQRLILQRQQALRRIGLIEPNYLYPIQSSIKSTRYYKFQDVIEPGIINQDICSICLNKKLQTQNIIKTKCNHFFHRSCVQTWATVDSRCPDCRTYFQIDYSQRDTQRKLISKENNLQLDTVKEEQHEQENQQNLH